MAQKKLRPAGLVLLVAIAALAWWLENRQTAETPTDRGAPTRADPGGPRAPGGALAEAIRARRSGVWVEGEGTIVHLLPDDREGDRHQLCLVELDFDHTIKISHNVDLAPKVPWKKGERLAFRGRFEWNDKGGVVHWTHHDPQGRQTGGWLRHAGETYE